MRDTVCNLLWSLRALPEVSFSKNVNCSVGVLKEKSCLFSFCRYESPEIALNCGIMLRECIRHEPLAKIILWSEQFYDFFRYVEMSTFDIASDAFATFKVTYIKTIDF